jgi:hypothetical protein
VPQFPNESLLFGTNCGTKLPNLNNMPFQSSGGGGRRNLREHASMPNGSAWHAK